MKRTLSVLAAVLVVAVSSQAGAQSMPPVGEVTNLDRWDFERVPLITNPDSFYLVAFSSPVDRARIYVYGIDVVSGKFLFAGTLARSLTVALTQRAGIDLGNFQHSGSTDPRASVVIHIEGPTPPPPPPDIHDFRVERYAQLAWSVAVQTDLAVQQLRTPGP